MIWFVSKNADRFGRASSLRPIDRVETEIIAQLRIRTGGEQERNEVRVTEDRREDQRRLAAARPLVDVGSVGEERTHLAGVAGSYCLR